MACSMLSNLPTQICFQQIHYCHFCTKYTNALWKVKYFTLTQGFRTNTLAAKYRLLFLPRISVRKARNVFNLVKMHIKKVDLHAGNTWIQSYKWQMLVYSHLIIFKNCIWISVLEKYFLKNNHGITNNWIFHRHIMSSSVHDTLLTFYCKPSRTLLQYYFRLEVIKLNSYFSFSFVLFYNHSVIFF